MQRFIIMIPQGDSSSGDQMSVDLSGLTNGQVLVWNGSLKVFQPSAVSGVAQIIVGHTTLGSGGTVTVSVSGANNAWGGTVSWKDGAQGIGQLTISFGAGTVTINSNAPQDQGCEVFFVCGPLS